VVPLLESGSAGCTFTDGMAFIDAFASPIHAQFGAYRGASFAVHRSPNRKPRQPHTLKASMQALARPGEKRPSHLCVPGVKALSYNLERRAGTKAGRSWCCLLLPLWPPAPARWSFPSAEGGHGILTLTDEIPSFPLQAEQGIAPALVQHTGHRPRLTKATTTSTTQGEKGEGGGGRERGRGRAKGKKREEVHAIASCGSSPGEQALTHHSFRWGWARPRSSAWRGDGGTLLALLRPSAGFLRFSPRPCLPHPPPPVSRTHACTSTHPTHPPQRLPPGPGTCAVERKEEEGKTKEGLKVVAGRTTTSYSSSTVGKRSPEKGGKRRKGQRHTCEAGMREPLARRGVRRPGSEGLLARQRGAGKGEETGGAPA
jgi:hypothetical protein